MLLLIHIMGLMIKIAKSHYSKKTFFSAASYGVIMCEQVKSLDIIARNVVFFEKVPKDLFEEVIDIIISFVEEI